METLNFSKLESLHRRAQTARIDRATVANSYIQRLTAVLSAIRASACAVTDGPSGVSLVWDAEDRKIMYQHKDGVVGTLLGAPALIRAGTMHMLDKLLKAVEVQFEKEIEQIEKENKIVINVQMLHVLGPDKTKKKKTVKKSK